MFYYGGTNKVHLSRDVLGCILNNLAEEHWYKLKFNLKITARMVGLHKSGTRKQLAKQGHIESLAGRSVMIEDISRCGSVNVFKRVTLCGKPNMNLALKAACRSGVQRDG